VHVVLASRRKLVGLAWAAGIVALPVLVYLAGWYPAAIERRIAATLMPTRSLDLVYRLDVVRYMSEPFLENPIIGIGLNQSPQYLPLSLVQGRVDAVHNVVLHNAVEAGLLAGFAWFLLPFVTLALWWRVRALRPAPESRRHADWLLCTLTGIYAAGQFTPALYEHVIFLLLGALAALAGPQSADNPRQ
jgi:O-antigen ligase